MEIRNIVIIAHVDPGRTLTCFRGLHPRIARASLQGEKLIVTDYFK